MNNKPTWPAHEPWWLFTPRSIGTGYLTLAAACLLLLWSGIELVDGSLGQKQTVLFVIIAVAALGMLFQSSYSLKKLLRQRNSR